VEPICPEDTLPDVSTEELLDALSLPGLGPVTVRRLLRHFGGWAAVRRASDAELREIGLKRDVVAAIRARRTTGAAKKEMAKAEAAGVRILSVADPEFPPSLRGHDHLPLLIYVKGELLERDALAIGVVGSRRASVYGRMMAERFSFELAQAGFTVVSGLAHGIDAAAHDGALKGGGRTLAVLGNGLGTVYPPEHRDLADRVVRSGALVSELPMDTAPTAANFPPRNRIIAGLALGVLVVEAAKQSGALISARLAGEMGREVFAIPGDVTRPQTRGVHRLIRDGAKLVETIEDILEELGPLEHPVRIGESAAPLVDPRSLTLNDTERKVFDLLGPVPKDIDRIGREAGIDAARVGGTLMVLEMKKLAFKQPGQLYIRAGTLMREE
jgi:DNA processing protein